MIEGSKNKTLAGEVLAAGLILPGGSSSFSGINRADGVLTFFADRIFFSSFKKGVKLKISSAHFKI